MANQQISVTSRDIENCLKIKGVRISQRTIRRRLNEAGAKFSPPMPKPLLNNDHQNNRLKWAKEHITMDWDQVIFSDETTLYLNLTKRWVWNLPGGKKVIRTVKHPIKVNLWGCFSSKGFGRIICFKENLNAELLCDIYKRGLLRTARRQFGPESTLWKLQEDNDPKHTSKLASKWRDENRVRKIDWPSMSPDLNPIENVWQLLKMRLGKKKRRNYRSMVLAIKREWKTFSIDLAIKLVQSMKSSVCEVIENQGDFILH